MTPCAVDSLADELDAVRRDSFRCTILERDDSDDGNANGGSNHTKDNNDANDANDHWFRNRGLVLDDACSESWLSTVQATRLSLPLNSKRPTVDRRFYRDPTRSVVCSPLEAIVRAAVEECFSAARPTAASATGSTRASTTTAAVTPPSTIYCNRYLRFLEYNRAGTELPPHRDGIKTCEETGIRSTHTLLLFLSDCPSGGETLLMDERERDEREREPKHKQEHKHKHKQEHDPDRERGTHWSRETNLELSHYDPSETDASPDAAFGADRVAASSATRDDGASGDPGSDRIPNPRRLRYTAAAVGSDRESSSGSSSRSSASPSVSFFCLSDATLTAAGGRGGDEVETERERECERKCDCESPPPPPPPRPSRGPPPPRSVSVGIQPACGRILLFPHHWAHAGALCKSVPKIALRAELAMVANQTKTQAGTKAEPKARAESDDAESDDAE